MRSYLRGGRSLRVLDDAPDAAPRGLRAHLPRRQQGDQARGGARRARRARHRPRARSSRPAGAFASTSASAARRVNARQGDGVHLSTAGRLDRRDAADRSPARRPRAAAAAVSTPCAVRRGGGCCVAVRGAVLVAAGCARRRLAGAAAAPAAHGDRGRRPWRARAIAIARPRDGSRLRATPDAGRAPARRARACAARTQPGGPVFLSAELPAAALRRRARPRDATAAGRRDDAHDDAGRALRHDRRELAGAVAATGLGRDDGRAASPRRGARATSSRHARGRGLAPPRAPPPPGRAARCRTTCS